jgi:anti-anti-sigma regulatory factor
MFWNHCWQEHGEYAQRRASRYFESGDQAKTMAKYRHRLFEMFDFRDEAVDAITTKSARYEAEAADPTSWTFKLLTVTLNNKVTEVRFNETQLDNAERESDLREDLAELVERLGRDSKVLFDFTDVQTFSQPCIDAVASLNQKLQNRGSRIVLCCLEPTARESFFTAR